MSVNPFEGIEAKSVQTAPAEKEKKRDKSDKLIEKAKKSKERKEKSDKDGDFKAKSEIIENIRHYGRSERFKETLKDFDFKQKYLESKTIEELNIHLSNIKSAIRSRRKGGIFQATTSSILPTIETVLTKSGAQVQGLSSEILKDDDMMDLLEEIKLEYASPFQIESPIKEFSILFLLKIGKTHMHNAQRAYLTKQPEINLDAAGPPMKELELEERTPERTPERTSERINNLDDSHERPRFTPMEPESRSK